ncbi:hypothetical protein F3Y22_tig00111582pilonHSYRG00290 [Hibiscus syriacus]|uniref:Uncharacterized protein n=1 Tax=Hibiscus syriacus TaxID=106335 RepID=A0A6A2XM67_HIBSY|nr:hypothetical protein F3Y22_tig00111582pilonHSYRG00290 [Hibiscus syriacus]
MERPENELKHALADEGEPVQEQAIEADDLLQQQQPDATFLTDLNLLMVALSLTAACNDEEGLNLVDTQNKDYNNIKGKACNIPRLHPRRREANDDVKLMRRQTQKIQTIPKEFRLHVTPFLPALQKNVNQQEWKSKISYSVTESIVGMSTWHLCSDDGSNYHWEAISLNLPSKLDDDPKGPPITKYPSMADLLSEGCSKLIENDDRGVDKYPMFRTEIGNLVALKESSIAKAISILNEDDIGSTDTPNGRSLSVSSEALQRARSVLGEPNLGDLFGEMDEEFLHIEFTQRKKLTMRRQTRKTTFLRHFPTKEQ